MPEIILEFSLNRSSGVLAGIVASLAQAGIELKSHKLQRATEGRGGWLTVTGYGDSPAPAVLAERLNGTRGVEKLVRVIVDGEAILAEGRLLEDQIQPDDLAELSVGSKAGTDTVRREEPEPPAAAGEPGGGAVRESEIEDLPILSRPEPSDGPKARAASESEKPATDVDENPVERDLAAALDSADQNPEKDRPAPKFAAEPTAEGDLADALQDTHEPAETKKRPSTADDENDPDRVIAALRRRRRRRR